jgi:hypothetical protein
MRAAVGRAHLVSQAMLAELAQLIDDVIIADGRLRRATRLADLYEPAARRLRVRGRDPSAPWRAFESAGGKIAADDEFLEVAGLSAEEAGEIAYAAGVSDLRTGHRQAEPRTDLPRPGGGPMIALVRSELYRMATIRSSWVSIVLSERWPPRSAC